MTQWSQRMNLIYVFGIWVLRSGDTMMLVVAVSYRSVEVAWPSPVNGSDLCFWHLGFEVRWCRDARGGDELWVCGGGMWCSCGGELWVYGGPVKWGDESCVWRGKKKDERERGRAHAHEVKLMRQGIWWVPSGWVKLQKCHITQFSITWKYSKCVFSFHNSSLKNQRIE